MLSNQIVSSLKLLEFSILTDSIFMVIPFLHLAIELCGAALCVHTSEWLAIAFTMSVVKPPCVVLTPLLRKQYQTVLGFKASPPFAV